jgi:hypothetical protein
LSNSIREWTSIIFRLELFSERSHPVESHSTLVTVFREPQQAEHAWKKILLADVDSRQISVIGKGHHVDQQASGYFDSGRGEPQYWGRHRSFWNNLWQSLPGAAFLWVPDFGPLIIAGPMATAVIAELHRSPRQGTLGVVGESMLGMGIPAAVVDKYQAAVLADHLLFLAQLTRDEAARAYEAAQGCEWLELEVHSFEAASA